MREFIVTTQTIKGLYTVREIDLDNNVTVAVWPNLYRKEVIAILKRNLPKSDIEP